VDSSIWEEPDHVLRVFIALMSLKDSTHMVSLDAYKLARRIHMPLDKVSDALGVLASPDTRRSGQEFEGRRIRAVEGGWEVINGEKYLLMVQREMRLARQRRGSANYRARKAGRPMPFPQVMTSGPMSTHSLPGEETFLRAQKSGASKEKLDKIVTSNLPEELQEPATEYRVNGTASARTPGPSDTHPATPP
jgi:hypothetical protein